MKRAKPKSELGQYLYSILTVVGLFWLFAPVWCRPFTFLPVRWKIRSWWVIICWPTSCLRCSSRCAPDEHFSLPPACTQGTAAGRHCHFRSPQDEGRDLIKRCVAVGGQEVHIINKVLHVDGKPVQEPPLAKHTDRAYYPRELNPRDNFGPYIVPEDHSL